MCYYDIKINLEVIVMTEAIKLISISQLTAGENIRDFAKVTKEQIQIEIENSKRPNAMNLIHRIETMLNAEKKGLNNKHEKESDILDLAQSIRRNGLLQPLIVTQDKNTDGTLKENYTVVAGHRRFFAIVHIIPFVLLQEKKQYIKTHEGRKKQKEEQAEEIYRNELVKFESIPCKIIDEQANLLEVQIAENLVRTDMTMEEKAIVVKKLYDELKVQDTNKGYSTVADRCNVSKSYIAKLVKLAEGRYKGRTKTSTDGKKLAMRIDEAKNFIGTVRSFTVIDEVELSGADVEPAAVILDEEIEKFERVIALLKQYKKKLVQRKSNGQTEQEEPMKTEGIVGAKRRRKTKNDGKLVSMADIDNIVQHEIRAK